MPMVRATGGQSTCVGGPPRPCARLDPVADPVPTARLREPAHLVSPRAVPYWLLVSVPWVLAVGAVAVTAVATAPDLPSYAAWLTLAGTVLLVAVTAAVPPLRYRVHRWEVTPEAVMTRTGWLSIEERVAPINRVQTVDSSQSAVQRLFRLRTLVVTTASAAGPIRIACLDQDVAQRLVADLTSAAAAAVGDAT